MRGHEGCHFDSSPDLRSQLILPSLRRGFHVFTLQSRMALFSFVSYFRFVIFHSFHNATGTGMQESNTCRPVKGPGLRLVFSRGIFFPNILRLSFICLACSVHGANAHVENVSRAQHFYVGVSQE
ncbi:hypothetical protein H112_05413 [Trichophyton rubrum D6]|uniref:Uncharacterized protein n=3 Tax=Trichophyton TaxID=5550 RepID=A0A080WI79_TRIRC|nr:uncharacterized protein TERG_11954 [Trichophyton rubrum CBS 118892]EZF18042.1 hypothetical protein H100_05432 [Trichophyton rubrum MR850]EZF40671.1 hypothetical protein H102_05395 [Trichophyton rubrum CBS 100081]EZF51297.1 hypothetical protein H103_05425 [Trichophyton rubrum CBS 288.86]EZF61922.1 hypothetical protein H104_05412 [Trichophyton rubrum CBS 289.86]EZF72553.1 hypothetical protein H105_05440 [Trichophyton soudanense CBS 452.61]EZF83242.1 hypothetical protein H110_05419 [Trichophy